MIFEIIREISEQQKQEDEFPEMCDTKEGSKMNEIIKQV